MLCEIHVFGNFIATWVALSVLGLVSILGLSVAVFYRYYVNPTYEMWRYKINPKYPSPLKVRDEITTMLKGLMAATLCPSLALWLAEHGYSKAYCGIGAHGLPYLVGSFFAIWILTDLWEFFYHWMGHTYDFFWSVHKGHHQFYNPSPFAVIADEWLDQFMRATPLLVLPLIAPVNMDLLFFEYSVFFYGYGVFLHWGYEFETLDAHNPILNTSFQHYLHHARSIKNKPYHTGFYFKVWDYLMGTLYDQACFCSKCQRKEGLRSKELWDKVEKPDYSVLLQPSFWTSQKADAASDKDH